ncbi:hypothetical protein IGI58_001256 [Enterococcus sp. AZ020]
MPGFQRLNHAQGVVNDLKDSGFWDAAWGVGLTVAAVRNAQTAGKKSGGTNNLLNPSLLDELSKSSVKYNPNNVVMVGKNSSNKLLWLEKGNNKAGLKHILNGHVKDFSAKGIQDIPNFLHDTLKANPIKQGTGPKGPYSVYIIDGQKYTLAYGNNGFVISFYPSK